MLVGPIEHDMSAFSASEILAIGRKKQGSATGFIKICDALEKAITKIQKNRTESAKLLCGLLLIMLVILLELPFAEYFASLEKACGIFILLANSVLISGGTVFLLISIYRILDIRLRKAIP